MDFAFSDEQEMLRSSARDWLADRWPIAAVAAAADGEEAPRADLAELGWLDPELSVLDTAVLFEECGAALFPGPLFSSVALGVPGQTGSLSTLAWAEPGSPRIGDPVGTVAGPDGTLRGRKIWVPDASSVETLFVTTKSGIFHVPLDSPGLTLRALRTLDGTRRLSEITFDGAPAELVAGVEVLPLIRLRALVAAAAEAVGVAQRMLDLATAHAAQREQFGRVIGTYQAVSHQVADCYVRLELARSLAYWAAWAVDSGDPDAPGAAAAAKATAAEAAVANAEAAIQIHGGIGFTWDSPLHRYYKRAQWLDSFDGPGRTQRADLAAALLDAGA